MDTRAQKAALIPYNRTSVSLWDSPPRRAYVLKLTC